MDTSDQNNSLPHERELVFTQDGVSVKLIGANRHDTIWYVGHVEVVVEPYGPVFEWKPNESKTLSTEGVDKGWENVNSVAIGYRAISPEVVRLNQQRKKINPIVFDLKEIKSYRTRKGRRKKAIKLNFYLRDGTAPPTLYFSLGDPTCLIAAMSKYIQFERSPRDRNLFLVMDGDTAALKKSFSELHIFENQAPDLISKFLQDPYSTTLGGFSKVTNFLWGNSVPTMHTPGQIDELLSDHDEEPEFEIISCLPSNPVSCNQNDLPPRTPVERAEPLSPSEWTSFFDSQGRIQKKDILMQKIFKGGVNPSLRKQVWKFLLGYYPYNSTVQEREEIRKHKEDEYFVMKLQWKSMTATQESRFSALRERKSLIEKDVNRTDRTHPYYEGEDNPNITVLFDILMSYVMYNFDLGYVQGMSDLLSPILVVMDNEVDAFWCFVGYMEMVCNNFEMEQHGMKQQLQQLHCLLQVVDPDLFAYLEGHESGNLYFCFRWLLILFKREFRFQEIMKLWEVLWTGKPCKNFHLLICLAILGKERDTLRENEYGLTEILKHINDMAYQMDLESILKDAESIFHQLNDCKELPANILDILGLKIPSIARERSPDIPVEKRKETPPIQCATVNRGEVTCHSPDSNGSADTSSIEVIPEDLETHFLAAYDNFT